MFFQLFLLIVTSIIVITFIKNRFLSKIITLFLSVFISLELFSIYIGGTLIDYKFYLHANLNDIWKTKESFLLQGITTGILIIVLFFLIHYSAKKIHQSSFNYKNLVLFSIIFISILTLSIPNKSVFSEIYTIYKIQTTKDINFKQALSNLGIPPNEYIKPKDLKAKSGKNIIIISMESIEKGFLNPSFKHVTPNLQRLSKELTYFSDMPQGPYSGWTVGSLYTFLTGFPAIMKGNGNEIFKGSKKSKITGLGHILSKAGYQSKFLIGEADFAGTRDLLNTYGLKATDFGDLNNKYKRAQWGLFDTDLFTEAQDFISKESHKSKPFALFLSTISTHPPHGVIDKRMTDKLPSNLSNHEFSIATLDYLINHLILYLKKENLYDNTSIYIFPDHKLMGLGSEQSIFNRLGTDRKLFLLTNVNQSKFSKNTNETIYQIDLPRLIIEGADIKTNAVFLTDFIKPKNTIDFLNSHLSELTKLNTASLTKDSFKGNLKISIHKNSLMITSEDAKFTVNTLNFKKGIAKEFIFTQDLVLSKVNNLHFGNTFNFNNTTNDNLHLLLEIKDNLIYAYFGNKNQIGFFKKGINNITLLESQITETVTSSRIYSESVKNKPLNNTIKNISDHIIKVTSSNFNYNKIVPTSAVFEQYKYEHHRGLNLIYFNKTKDTVEFFDTHGSDKDTFQLISRLKQLHKNNTEYILFAHDSAAKNIHLISNELKCLGFFDLTLLKNRQPYIAYYNNGLSESIGKHTLTTFLPWHVTITKHSDFNISKINNNSIDQNRFIAHAGGQINHVKYTNSLEALNNSYKKGFRLFELDINKTSDGFFVATHDWKTWQKKTDFKGQIPPTKEQFLQKKILNKYTPLDMTLINHWFTIHQDATLVTDKVNTPIEFSLQFIDKNRLMMELFSLKAVKEGLKSKLKLVLLSENVLNNLKGNKVEVLIKLGVKGIAISRKSILKNRHLLLQLKKHGIKTYVFHVNFGIENEEYVLFKEFNYVYGMYADLWHFDTSYNCN